MLGNLFIDYLARGDGGFRLPPAMEAGVLIVHEPNRQAAREAELLHLLNRFNRTHPADVEGSNSNDNSSEDTSEEYGSDGKLEENNQQLWAQRLSLEEAEPGGRLAAAGKNTIPAVRRLIKELQVMQTDPPENTWARPRSMDNLLKWRAKIRGPEGSPYEQGIFEIALSFSEAYPFEPPIVRFITPVYHCNVNSLGYICLDALNEHACWSPGLTVDKMLLSLSSMLNDADPLTAYNSEAASVFIKDRGNYERIAREWTQRHAMEVTWET